MDTSAQTSISSAQALLAVALPLVIFLILFLAVIIGLWKVFVKAGHPGWACIVPFYNIYCLVKIAGKEWWWLLLYCIPIVNMVVGIPVMLGISRNFGKSVGFAIGLFLLPFIFFPILGFGDAAYAGENPA